MDSDCEGSRAPGLISFNNFSAFLHPGFSFCMFHFIRGQLQCWYFDIFNLVQNWNCEIPRKFQSLSRLPGALLSTLHFCSINFCATSCCEHKNQNLNNHSKTLQTRQHLRTHDATSRSHSTFSFQVTKPLLKWQKLLIISLNLFISHANSPNIQSNFKILYNIMPICLSRYVRPICNISQPCSSIMKNIFWSPSFAGPANFEMGERCSYPANVQMFCANVAPTNGTLLQIGWSEATKHTLFTNQ